PPLRGLGALRTPRPAVETAGFSKPARWAIPLPPAQDRKEATAPSAETTPSRVVEREAEAPAEVHGGHEAFRRRQVGRRGLCPARFQAARDSRGGAEVGPAAGGHGPHRQAVDAGLQQFTGEVAAGEPLVEAPQARGAAAPAAEEGGEG